MEPVISMNNRNDPAYEERMDDLVREVFGFSFAPWFARGLWDDRYESYSIMLDGQMAANLCIYKTDLIVSGKPMHAHQYGAVAVRPECRGKGFARRLMEAVLIKYPDTPAYLAANDSVLGFYPRMGFRRVYLHRPVLAAEVGASAGPAVKVDPLDKGLWEALLKRSQYSRAVASLNSEPVEMFHMILDYPDAIYFIPELGCYVVAEKKGRRLFVADVILDQPISFTKLKAYLPFSEIREVEFGFCPDHLDVSPEWMPFDETSSPFFIRGEWTLPEYFRFSEMAET